VNAFFKKADEKGLFLKRQSGGIKSSKNVQLRQNHVNFGLQSI